MFKDTDRTVFVSRLSDGAIYGIWAVRQFEGHEEILEDSEEAKSFVARPKPAQRLDVYELAAVLVAKRILTETDISALATSSIP